LQDPTKFTQIGILATLARTFCKVHLQKTNKLCQVGVPAEMEESEDKCF
jgi:hypothetical protein